MRRAVEGQARGQKCAVAVLTRTEDQGHGSPYTRQNRRCRGLFAWGSQTKQAPAEPPPRHPGEVDTGPQGGAGMGRRGWGNNTGERSQTGRRREEVSCGRRQEKVREVNTLGAVVG